MAQEINDLTCAMYDLGAGIDSKSLANCLSAHRQTGHQRGHHQGHHLGPGKIEIAQDLGRNGRRSRTGHNTADIANHIVTDGADTLSIAQKADGILGTGDLTGGHRVERCFVGRGHCHTDHIKLYTHQHNDQQDQKSGNDTASCHDLIGDQGDHAGYKHGYEEDRNHPADRLISLFSPIGWVTFGRHRKFSFDMLVKNGSRQDKSYGLGRVGFPLTVPAVAAQAVSV